MLDSTTSAEEVLDSRSQRRSLSTAAHIRLKRLLLSDSYLFAKKICRHNDLVPKIHMPLSYLACGLTDRLCETLDMPTVEGYVTRKLRQELTRRFGPKCWQTIQGRAQIDELINGSMIRPAILNLRLFRRIFKSSTITHAGTLFIATNDPNETIKITHAVDPKAWEFCEQIATTVLSGTYRDFFPERIPDDISRNVTMKRINLGGRTISHPQPTISASGVGTTEESAHYSTFVTDDLITENDGPEEIRHAVKWMKALTGFYMPTRKIRRLEVGTKHDEDDDDTFLTVGRMAEECLTLRIPIEEHKGRVTNILERGTPTVPELFPPEKITAEQTHVLSGEQDEDGYRTWWNQYLLSATGGTLRLFPPDIVDDPDRWWMGPYDHPNANWQKKGRYLVARYKRDRAGNPIAKRGETIHDKNGGLIADWRDLAERVSADPWTEMDRVILVDPAWADNADSDNWAVSCVGQDYEDVRMQLETLSDNTGIEGWVSALAYMDEKWQPRRWGIDATAAQDPMIENIMRTDKRMRRLMSRMIKLHHSQRSKGMRMQEGLAQPLMVYRFLLAPSYRDGQGVDRFGGNMTRSELKLIKSTAKHSVSTDQDGIADSLSMAAAIGRAARKQEQKTPQRKPPVDPYLGVPLSGAL